MSKKRRWQPVSAVDVEEARAQLRVAPERVLVVGRHVVRDDVEHDAEPAARASQSARNACLAAELVARSVRGSTTS